MIANIDTRAGRMLAAGGVTVTVTSKVTGEHITLKADCCAKAADGSWSRVTLAEASHVFINRDKRGQRVGTFYPRSGDFYPAKGCTDKGLLWAAKAVLAFALQGDAHPQADFAEASCCGACNRKLTDPESIARGIGPECYGRLTDSIPYSTVGKAKVEAPKVEATPAPAVRGKCLPAEMAAPVAPVEAPQAPVAEAPEEQARERSVDGTRKGSKASKLGASQSKADRIAAKLALLPEPVKNTCPCGAEATLFGHCTDCDREYLTRSR